MKGITKQLIAAIVAAKDPDQATQLLTSSYSADQSISMYSTWSRVRQHIAKDPINRNKYYFYRLEQLMKHDGLPPEDFLKLESLKESPLYYQHRVQSSRRKYLSSDVHDKWLHLIPALIAPVYKFVLPETIVSTRKCILSQRAKMDQTHCRKIKSEYKCSDVQLQDWINISKATVASIPVVSTKQYYEVIVSLQLLTGRRNYEIINSLEIKPVIDNKYQAHVCGILKRGLKNEETDIIPINEEFVIIDHALRSLREFKRLLGDPSAVNSQVGGSIAKASLRLFNRKLTHTQKRNLYVEVAWREREKKNKFCVGEESCSRTVWVGKALGHKFTPIVTLSNRYDALVIENENS